MPGYNQEYTRIKSRQNRLKGTCYVLQISNRITCKQLFGSLAALDNYSILLTFWDIFRVNSDISRTC